MTLDACAALIEKGDPDRWQALLAAPVAARARLLPLYALNLEVARAPWLTREPMIAEMRLQWWRDVVEEAAAGKAPRAHEVAGPLSDLIRGAGLPVDVLDALIAARRHDAWKQAFAGETALDDYLADTAGGLMWLSALALGAGPGAEAAVRAYGRAAGLAAYFTAVPELSARGRAALPDPAPGAVRRLAERGLGWLAEARAARATVPRRAAPALLAGWQAGPLLRLAAATPEAVGAGGLHLSEFSRRGRLLWQAMSGRW
ncbi:squalene/phytoene synthase family protein [Pseudogemmobacter humi]|uniref:Squalene/phytoene synthase n=1 Tax=Pseudogemmobacter humi TaxID=2483812 RepID=A0A3P5X8R3_9RHOB|nr:squalene/phytoene synthase family protein [Pseudogemmobacter humi]VDC30840.1 Squalene/phytoene synthase [Pseudogemmobacter humi]